MIRYKTNYTWFNRFLNDVKQLLDKIAESLSPEYSLATTSFYYPKSNYVPSIPPYLLMGMGGRRSALQIYAIFDLEIIRDDDIFVTEPSLILVRHSREDKILWADDYGLKVIKSKTNAIIDEENGVISGQISGKAEANFHAFQVPFSYFTGDQSTEKLVQTKIVDVLLNLPDWKEERKG